MANVLEYGLDVSEFELESRYYVHFRTWKKYKPPNLSSYGSNIITSILLKGSLWHEITHEGWYAI